ncbi:zinc metallopeptidase [Blattabacterium cuenoti]|uniref:zinc metallopeptidase n=1 Tax=Blattabacterium cuenoti TaxID=1653831 RepID=UPI00163BD472|nr:zinc metallopeptidase [Blattabacterium cuenoti]
MGYYFIVGIIFIINNIINAILKNRLNFYSKIRLNSNMNGKEIAEKMLSDNGILDVKVFLIEGELTDHYNPSNKTINLSSKIFNEKNSVSTAVAAHECGHALQHKIGYRLLKIRNGLTYILNLSSKMAYLSMISGLAIFYGSEGGYSIILKIGLVLFFLVFILSIITLPIEFDASSRALNWLKNNNIVNNKEFFYVKKTLKWAVLTYVFSMLSNLVSLMYFTSYFKKNHDYNKDEKNN